MCPGEPAGASPVHSLEPRETEHAEVRAFLQEMGIGPVGVGTCHHLQLPIMLEAAFLPVLPLLPSTPRSPRLGRRSISALCLCLVTQGPHSLKVILYKAMCYCSKSHKQSLFSVYLSSLFICFPALPPAQGIWINNELSRSSKGSSLTSLGKASNDISSS